MTSMGPTAAHPGDSSAIDVTCSYVPGEIVLAAGFLPRRIIPPRQSAASAGFLHPNTCSYLKCLLAHQLAHQDPPARATVVTNSCDGARRLFDLLVRYRPGVPAIFLDIPKSADRASLEWFTGELAGLAARLEALPGASRVTEERLREAIGQVNRVRGVMESAFASQRDPGSAVTGAAAYALAREGAESDPTRFAKDARNRLSRAGGTDGRSSGPRICLTASLLPDPGLIEIVENAGARVVSLDTCITSRLYEGAASERSLDPMLALAERYLSRPPCPRMTGITARLEALLRLASDSGADGVLCCVPKFCDMASADAPVIREGFRRAGVPFQILEYEYEGAASEQTRTRVEAFLETVRAARR